jgi:hypothetical protein
MGTTCAPEYPKTGSLDQGAQFSTITKAFHGGARKSLRRNKKMSGSRRRSNSKRSNSKRSNSKRSKQRGGSYFTPYADYPTSFDHWLPKEMSDAARVSSLDAKFAELPAVERAAGEPMRGGRRTRRFRGGMAPVDASPVILQSSEELAAARLNPQWYTENTVVPNFRGDVPYNGGVVSASPQAGGRRRNRSRSTRNRRSRRNATVKRSNRQA